MDSIYEVTGTVFLQRHNSAPSSNVSAQPGDILEAVGSGVYRLDRSARSDGVLKVDISQGELDSLLAKKIIQKRP